MDDAEQKLRHRLLNLLEVYSLEDILALNDLEDVDILLFLLHDYDINLPEEEPLGD